MINRFYPVIAIFIVFLWVIPVSGGGNTAAFVTKSIASEHPSITGNTPPSLPQFTPDLMVTRGSRFVTTITGPSDTSYYIWMKGTSALSGDPGNQPPVLLGGQEGVTEDPPGGPYLIGAYQFSGGGGRTIRDDVPHNPSGGTEYYALVTTSDNGDRTVGWSTSLNTRTGTYHSC